MNKRVKELEEAWIAIVKILESVGLGQNSCIKTELGEEMASYLYNGRRIKGSQKGLDVISKDGMRIQAKFRTTKGINKKGEFIRNTPIKASNFNCDMFVEVVTHPKTAQINHVIEYKKEDVEKLSSHDAHDNINRVSAAKLKKVGKIIYER